MKMKNKRLDIFWNRTHNAFLAAIQNEEVKKYIEEYRETWHLHGHASTTDELENQIRQMFLQDAGLVNGAEFKDYGGIERNGNEVFIITKGMDGRETRWSLNNPFIITDGDKILVPENKQRLIHILSDKKRIEEYSWIFEPRLQVIESEIVYPLSHILISILHKTDFLRRLSLLLGRLNLDYFLHWPLFFYYILTGDPKFVLENVAFQFMPYRLFVVCDDHFHKSWLIKSYGNADIPLLQDFIKINKSKLKKLSEILNNPNTSGRSIKELNILMRSKEMKKNRDLALIFESPNIKKNSAYLDALRKEGLRTGKIPSSYELKNNPSFRKNKLAENRIKSYKSRAKKFVEKISQFEPPNSEIGKLVDEINNIW